MKCKICKKQIEKPFRVPELNKTKYPVCSKECYKTYLELWRNQNE